MYDNFNIGLKSPILNLKIHTNNVLSLTIMNDGRLVSGARDYLIVIYNKKTYQPDLIIKEHQKAVLCICQLSSGELVSCSEDKTINIFIITGKKYEIIQTLKYHIGSVYKIIELKNKSLSSCSGDASIIFYCKDKSKFNMDYKVSTDGTCSSIIQTKDNEICYSQSGNQKICFFDLLERKIISSISNISKRNYTDEWLILITKDLLSVPGEDQISIINVNQYKLVRIIEVSNSDWIFGSCMLNEKMLLTGERHKAIRQWKIDEEESNLILISKKDNAHYGDINFLLNLGNGHIASGSDGGIIKIW